MRLDGGNRFPLDPEPHATGTIRVERDGYAARTLRGNDFAFAVRRGERLYRRHVCAPTHLVDIRRVASGERDDDNER